MAYSFSLRSGIGKKQVPRARNKALGMTGLGGEAPTRGTVNILQWVLIPQKRLVYYYYFPPAVFLGVAIVLGRVPSPRIFGFDSVSCSF
jgi:hypothetical protein